MNLGPNNRKEGSTADAKRFTVPDRKAHPLNPNP